MNRFKSTCPIAVLAILKRFPVWETGVITPDEAGQVASLIGANARLIALTELNQKMDALIKDEN